MPTGRGIPAATALAAIAGTLSACDAAGPETRPVPAYLGVETRLLDDDLVSFRVAMRHARSNEDLTAYARCAAAQYALIRGYGFARHLRTNFQQRDGVWRADAVYTISASLPRGMRTLDAEAVTEDCVENGIPAV